MDRRLYEFGPYRLDVAGHSLLRQGAPVGLPPKAFDVLLALLERRDRVVEKAELMALLWPDSFVEEANLTQTIFILRKALGEDAEGHRYIETIPKRGYRFAAKLTEASDETSSRPESGAAAAGPPGLGARLRWLIPAMALVAGLTLAGGYWLENRGGSAAAATGIRSLAVLPFQPLGPTSTEDDYLGLGVADALITQLGNSRHLTVRPTAAVRPYVRPNRDPAQAGRELGVEWVLDGSIQRSGDRLRTTVQLIRAADGAPSWSERFDEPWTDILTVEDSIAVEVSRALAPRLEAAEQRQLAKRYTSNPRAHELYLRSRYFWNKRSADPYLKAIEYARQAIAEDPGYSLAYAGLADSYALLGSLATDALPRPEAMTRAKEAATKALAIDESLAEAHTSLAFVLMHYDWNWPESEKEFRRAIELNPGYATAHHWYAFYLTAQRRHREAIAEIKQAQELDPLSMIINTDVAEMYYYARQYDQAIAYARKALEIDPEFPLAHKVLGLTLVQQKQYDPAISELRRVVKDRVDELGSLGHALAVAGKRDEARRVLRTIEQLSRERYGLTLTACGPRLALGETDEAFNCLERAYAQRDGGLILLSAAPYWDPFRSDSRFVDLVRRMGLPLSSSES